MILVYDRDIKPANVMFLPNGRPSLWLGPARSSNERVEL